MEKEPEIEREESVTVNFKSETNQARPIPATKFPMTHFAESAKGNAQSIPWRCTRRAHGSRESFSLGRRNEAIESGILSLRTGGRLLYQFCRCDYILSRLLIPRLIFLEDG